MSDQHHRDDDKARSTDYRGSRIGAAAALIAVLILMLLVDAFSNGYEASWPIVTAILGTVAGLLAVELRFRP